MRAIDADAAIDTLNEQIEQCNKALGSFNISLKDEYAIKVERASLKAYKEQLENMPSIQPERKTGHWILDRSGAYCCNKCMEPCASYVMMKHRDKFCKMCGAKMEGETE